MPAPPKPNQIPIILKDVKPREVSFVFDDDKEIPPKVPIYMNDTDIAIGTVVTLSDNVFYSEEEDDKGNKGNYLYDENRHPIDYVKNLTNSFYIKQSELAGGAQPPSLHPGRVHIDNLVVGNEYEFVIQIPNDPQQRVYRGTLMPLMYQNLEDPPLRISNYTIDGESQDGYVTFPLSFIQTEPPPQQPSGGGKKKKAKKTKKAKNMKKTKKSKKTKKTGRKSIRRRRR
uniref:Uncharacterized protein n=1 Tax=viral metagenome TaxID=1070528 RepID=A0A6C0ATQ0_9ZZZZ|tara:strand:+ start:23472 stop:24155 length:684 start_codon:yes stop_codon:yes gene_type:complete